jgi:hypothetical protein
MEQDHCTADVSIHKFGGSMRNALRRPFASRPSSSQPSSSEEHDNRLGQPCQPQANVSRTQRLWFLVVRENGHIAQSLSQRLNAIHNLSYLHCRDCFGCLDHLSCLMPDSAEDPIDAYVESSACGDLMMNQLEWKECSTRLLGPAVSACSIVQKFLSLCLQITALDSL